MSQGGKRWQLLAFDTDTGADRFRYSYYPEGSKDRVKNFFGNPYYAGVEAVGGGALAVGSIGGVIYLTPEPATSSTRLFAPADRPSSSSPSSSSSWATTLGVPLAALVAAVLLLLAAVVLRNVSDQGAKQRQQRGRPRLSLVEGEEQEEEEDEDMRYHALLPSTVVGVEGH